MAKPGPKIMTPGKGRGWARWGFPGMVIAWPFVKSPSGWLLCNGQAISRRSRLGRLLVNDGSLWGDGDGYKTVNIPDFTGRVLVMSNTEELLVGDCGGHKEQRLTVDQLPPHAHVFAGPQQSQGVAIGKAQAFPVGMQPQKTTRVGQKAPISIMQPFGVVSIIIRL